MTADHNTSVYLSDPSNCTCSSCIKVNTAVTSFACCDFICTKQIYHVTYI